MTPAARDRTARSERSDREVVDLVKAGDTAAFGELVLRHHPRLHRLAVHMVRSSVDADEVVQDTFLRAYQALGRFDGRSEVFTWLYRIAVNLCLNQIRAKKTLRLSGDTQDGRLEGTMVEDRPSMKADPHADLDRRAVYGALCEGIDSLSETLRTTLLVVCIDGCSHDEAAAILGAPSGTIAWRVHEARKKLREFMNARGHRLDSEEEGRT